MRILKKFIFFTIIIGIVALALNNILGNATITYLEKHNVQIATNNFYYWKFNFFGYIENIRLTATDISVLQFKLPTRVWRNINNASDLYLIGNNLAVVLDYIILILNVILYPIKISAYLLQNALAITGVNSRDVEGNGLYWLYYFTHNILANFVIPYI